MRICFIVNKLLVSGNWAYKLYNMYVAVVTIRLEGVSVIVINIYNFIDNKKVTIIERFIKLALDQVKKEIILLKNFNTYHPTWGSRAVATEI